MSHYRAYPLDNSGHFTGVTDFEAIDDSEALHVVEGLAEAGRYEIWCGERFVGQVRRDDNVIHHAPPLDRSAIS